MTEDTVGVLADAVVPAATVTHPAAHAAAIAPRVEFHEPSRPEPATAPARVPVPAERPRPAVPSHATVAFDSGDGQEGRLRVSLRGNALRATIQLPDAAAAQRLELESGSLLRALRAQGFEEPRLVIDTPRAAGTAEQGREDSSSREHKNPREGQPHTGERNARRERGTSRNER